ncbi:putative ribonuclease H-like domain-containing protein [Tanacetum coccineum]
MNQLGVSTEDANQKFLRSLPSAWSQIYLIMRTKPGVDSLSFDDLYNNLRVFKPDVKGFTASSSSTQNVAFVYENTSCTNEVSTAYGASSSFGHNPQREGSSSYTDELMYSFFANQSSGPQLDHEDLEQLDEFDLEEMDLKWQVAMISMRLKKFYKKTGRKLQFDAKEPVGFDKAKEEPKALVTLDGEGVDWTSHSEDEQENYALMAYSNSGSDTEVTSCSKECKESYAKLKKLYDEQREQLGDASIEIQAYTQALKKVEAQLVAHQQNQLWYEENIRFMKIDLDDKTDVLTYHKKLLAEAEKEKEELKAKVEKWHNSSKNLNILLTSQMSARDKAGLGSSDIEDSPSQFTYGLKQSKPSESDARSSDFNSLVSQPKVWSDAPIIEEYESDSDDEHVSSPSKEQETPRAYLAEYQTIMGGPVAFGGITVYITGKGKIKTRKLDFEDVCFVKELQHFNLFSVSQICDKKNSFNLENIVPSGGLACLIAKAIIDESNKWHRRLGHANFKNLNKLVKGNLVRGLPSNIFQNDHTCVACQKGRQHKASCRAKSVCYISQPLQLLHMDLFGPTSVRTLNHKTYYLIITDDFRRFSWVFFLRTKDETSGILKNFIRQIENQLNQKVKTIRCDNGTEFKNMDFIEFYGSKGIKREYSNARTPQQNRVAERKNRTLIEAARTMLADSFLPNTFWAEVVSTACKFDGKSDEGFLVGYSLNSKAFRVYNLETKRVEENLHITFLENKPNVAGKGPNWLFDLDYLTDSMNYQHVRLENQAYKNVGPKRPNHIFLGCRCGTKDNIDAENSKMEAESAQDYFVLPIWSSYTSTVKSSEAKNEGEKPNKSNEKPVDQEDQAFLEELERLKSQEKEANDAAEALRKEFAQDTEDLLLQAGAARANSTNTVNTASTPVSTISPSGSMADFTNLETIVNVSPIQTSRIYSIHPSTQILGDPKSAVQTRSKVNKSSGAHAFVSYIQKQRRNNHKDFQHCLFACFLSQIEPKKISEALEDESWINAMQEEVLQFKIQKVWILVDLPYGKKAIGTKWDYKNNKDKRGVVVRNKARLVTQGHRQEEGIDYDEVFAPVARIEAIRIFLAFASFMGFIVYQIDVKSAFLYGTIDEEVYVSQPPSFVDPKCPKKVYKVVKALYGLHQAPKAWYDTLSNFLLKNGYRRGTIDKTLFIKKDKNDIILVQVYVDGIIFGSTKRSWCDEFEALMKNRFRMSSMGELTFFLGLQFKQKKAGIFIS